MGLKEIESGYQENFEDVLRDARLEGKNCTIYMAGGMPPVGGKTTLVDANAVHLECDKGYIALIRPQNILALFIKVEEIKPNAVCCPYCGR